MRARRSAAGLAALALAGTAPAGCTLGPRDARPALPVPASWPVGDPYLAQSEAALPSVTWRQVFLDPGLQRLIGEALANNRDLRVAVANIAAARAQYRVQRAELFPEVDAAAGYTRTGTGAGNTARTAGDSFSLNAGTTAFELDLFGRVRSLTRAQADRYFASQAAAQATRLSLIGNVAAAWLAYAADASLLRVAGETAAIAEAGVRLTDARLKGGVAPRTDLTQAQTILATAQAAQAAQRTLVAQDRNALQLLVGAPVDAGLLSTDIEAAARAVAPLPAGLDSSILLRRPDVVEAEYQLYAANAAIGAARAALLPRVSLTGLAGLASAALGSLFTGGAFAYSAAASASYPIFRAGAGVAGVRYSQAQRDAALATYEKAIQAAFQETGDALAREGTITDQLRAERRNVAAARTTLELVGAQYRGGITTFLASLDAQRTFYAAQQTLVVTLLTAGTNRATLYRVLGGDATLAATPAGPRPVTPTGAERADEPLPPARPGPVPR